MLGDKNSSNDKEFSSPSQQRLTQKLLLETDACEAIPGQCRWILWSKLSRVRSISHTLPIDLYGTYLKLAYRTVHCFETGDQQSDNENCGISDDDDDEIGNGSGRSGRRNLVDMLLPFDQWRAVNENEVSIGSGSSENGENGENGDSEMGTGSPSGEKWREELKNVRQILLDIPRTCDENFTFEHYQHHHHRHNPRRNLVVKSNRTDHHEEELHCNEEIINKTENENQESQSEQVEQQQVPDLNQIKVSMFHILYSLSKYYPSVGYCQGMSYICAELLTVMESEEDAFLMFVNMMERYEMHELFRHGFPKLRQLQFTFDRLFQKRDSRLFHHLERLGVSSGLYLTKWYLCLFCQSFPQEFVLRLWDAFLFRGWISLHQIVFAMFNFFRRELLACRDMERAIEIICQDMPKFVANGDNRQKVFFMSRNMFTEQDYRRFEREFEQVEEQREQELLRAEQQKLLLLQMKQQREEEEEMKRRAAEEMEKRKEAEKEAEEKGSEQPNDETDPQQQQLVSSSPISQKEEIIAQLELDPPVAQKNEPVARSCSVASDI